MTASVQWHQLSDADLDAYAEYLRQGGRYGLDSWWAYIGSRRSDSAAGQDVAS